MEGPRERARAPERSALPPPDWRTTVRSRLIVAAAVFAVWTAGIEARLLYLQVFRHADMVARAARQRMNTLEVPARRGDILDRNGRVLAYSVDADSIFADPTEVEDPDRTAALVCRALDRCDAADRQAIAKNLRRSGQFAYIARKVSPDEEQRIRALELKGIGVIKESRRFYPKRELLSHVLGYVGVDNAGLGGLEAAYDALIRGRAGRIQILRDARRNALTSHVEREATAGATLELTIDQYLQNIAERELAAGIAEHRAAGGSVVVMDPNNGEILAMANAPTFNPNVYARSPEQHRRNRAIQDLYEPGSTFKIVTASAALEENVMTPEDSIDTGAGVIRFGSRQIDDMHRYGVLSFTDVIVKSSNVGAVKIGLRLGPEKLGRYVARFGFGQTLLPDFRGENPGIVWNPAKLDSSALASVSMGYQVGVTPVQMASAVSAVANGGTLHEPRVVRAVIKDGQRVEVEHKALRRPISEHTAARLTAIMEAVVERGTAKTRQDRRLHDRRQDRHGAQDHRRPLLADRIQRVVRRVPAVAQARADDHRADRFAARQRRHGRCRLGADLQADRRSVAPASRHGADGERTAAGAGRLARKRIGGAHAPAREPSDRIGCHAPAGE